MNKIPFLTIFNSWKSGCLKAVIILMYTTPTCMRIYLMRSNTRMKNKHILMLGISTVIIKIFYHFLFLRGRGEPCILHHIIHHSTRNRNIYGLGEWISTVFKIFGLFLFYAMKESELQNYPIGSWPT